MKNLKFKAGLMTIPAVILTIMVFSFITGCEEMLQEALKKEIDVNEELFDSQEQEKTEDETVDVGNAISLGGSSQAVGKTYSGPVSRREVQPEEAALFAWVLSKGGGELRGTVVNRDAASVLFKVRIGSDEVFENAVEVGSLTLAGNQTQQFVFSGAEFEEFFDAFFENNSETVHVFFTADESSSINLMVNLVHFRLQPSHVLERIVEQNADYAEYADHIEEIKDINLTGTISNNSSNPMHFLLRLSPTEASNWESIKLAHTINANENFNLNDWRELMEGSGVSLDDLEAAIRHLATGSIKAELFFTVESELRLNIVSVTLSCKVKVGI